MYDDLPTIAATVDAAGFVLVDGTRVLNTPGKMLRAAEPYRVTCPRCHAQTPRPLRVVSEVEPAIGCMRHFHAPEIGAWARGNHCPAHEGGAR
jgi:hypothetical protein